VFPAQEIIQLWRAVIVPRELILIDFNKRKAR